MKFDYKKIMIKVADIKSGEEKKKSVFTDTSGNLKLDPFFNTLQSGAEWLTGKPSLKTLGHHLKHMLPRTKPTVGGRVTKFLGKHGLKQGLRLGKENVQQGLSAGLDASRANTAANLGFQKAQRQERALNI